VSPVPAGVRIQRATPADLGALEPLFHGYLRFYGKPIDEARVRAFLAARIGNGESVVYLARDEASGDALGFVQLYPAFASLSQARSWVLNDLFVAESARRAGVAHALLAAAADFARGEGAAGLVLETTRDNAPARALYRAAGWHEDDTQWYSLSLA